MRLESISRTKWLLAGLALRTAMLGWGAYQDATSSLPYTDVDYLVFTSASRHLVSSCPLERVISASPQEEYSDLSDPPEARDSCAQGIIPAVSRFVLQTEPEIREVNSDATLEPIKVDSKGSHEEWQDWLTSKSFGILRPIFRFFAGLGNPYKRETYRYTPLLAVLLAPGELLPSHWGPAFFGKTVFILADMLVALLIWDIMDMKRKGRRENNSWLAGLFWLLNPFTAQISTRGSSESLLGILVLGFLDTTLRSYPEKTAASKDVPEESRDVVLDEELDDSNWNNVALMAPFLFALSIHWKLYPIIYAAALVPHLIQSESFRGVLRYGGITVYSLVAISAPVYAIWGPPYLQETVFYHLSRSDHRHNFSPFFLPSYLSASPLSSAVADAWPSIFSAFLSIQAFSVFLPQLALTAYIGFSMGAQDLVAAMTFQTIAFVAFNKVCTSQYYVWIIWFLPIIAPSLHFRGGNKDVIRLVVVWILAQAFWLSQAYLLEFRALDTYVTVWIASLLLLLVHAWLLVSLVQAWANGRQKSLEVIDQELKKAAAAEGENGKTPL
jgi:phosphatidylinositol glycan class M